MATIGHVRHVALDWLRRRESLRRAVRIEEVAFHLASIDSDRFGPYWTTARDALDDALAEEHVSHTRYIVVSGHDEPPPLAHTAATALHEADPLAAPLGVAEPWAALSPGDDRRYNVDQAAAIAGVTSAAVTALLAMGYIDADDAEDDPRLSDSAVAAVGGLARTMRQTGAGVRIAAQLVVMLLDGQLGYPGPDAIGPLVAPMPVALPAVVERWRAWWAHRDLDVSLDTLLEGAA